ncbi:hypothetical protein LOZ12_002984 [Ophidiomyces ophidiicola]|uniref:Uncharacterized protein n=1 Tax=Ophidiomyces ophidiicola TaxID=1387563 RepID=A0ACB8UX78_9EURO|nr:hypothetical protein LOZ64_003930 [Ophidiomyces ophidiicola]KAI1945620.1 hypothetical protein LOZ62_003696 [Ophidiomyces ophidiicola]KAI1971639.1 hypothetical protein LOZ56_002926 [Ophidiomyces ophidiicola]KAI2006173.1 hypothetical protein LOZ50_003247 [Ophidiomyces ophidiicola]KAI2017478.1 hypothetical protein LOZ46_004403 [Ophidiomyces ophidiicola]
MATDLVINTNPPSIPNTSHNTTNQVDGAALLSFVPGYRLVTPTFTAHTHAFPRRLPPSPYPETPTPAASASRPRTRSWTTTVAVKAVKSVEALRPKKSFGALRKSGRKRRDSTHEIGNKYHHISSPRSNLRSTSSGPAYGFGQRVGAFSLLSPQVDKALPSEKPLPQTPEAKREPGLSPPSRSLIDAEERPLRRSPPGMPGVKEDWPILAPSAAPETQQNGPEATQLTTMAPKILVDDTCGIRLFGDAANRLAGTFNNTPCSPCNPKVTTDINVLGESVVDIAETGSANASNIQSSNPFRNKSRAIAVPGSAPETPANRNFSYTFDSQRRDTSHRSPKDQNVNGASVPENSVEYIAPIGKKASASKIPKISPGASPISPAFASGLAKRPMSPAFSPTHRSSIPVPSRFLRSYRSEQLPVTPINQKPAIATRNPESSITSIADNSGLLKEADSPKREPPLDLGLVSDNDESDFHFEEALCGEYVEQGGVRVKQLAHMSPSGGGPQLRISPEAEKIIMGEGDLQENTSKRNSIQGRWKAENRREFRISTDSLFGSLGVKRDRNPRARSSMGAVSVPEPSPKMEPLSRIPKVKSADLTIHSPCPPGSHNGHRALRRTESSVSPTGKTSNNPFFNKVLSKSSSFIANHGKKISKDITSGVAQVGESVPKEATRYNEIAKNISGSKHSPGRLGANDIYSSKTKRTPERGEARKNSTTKQESPKITRSQQIPSYRSSDRATRRNSHDHAHSSRTKIPHGMAMSTVHESHRIPGTPLKERTAHGHRSHIPTHTTTSQESVKPKTSSTKGVLSNFRGLFTKHKTEVTKETTAAMPPRPKERLSRKSKTSLNGGRSVTRSPVRCYQAMFGTDREVQASNELQNNNTTLSINSSTTHVVPAFADTRNVSGLAMEVLDTARVESNSGKKEELVRLGKFLIEAVNHSNDAEKAMITAIQAAKQAEISCALAKENALRIGNIAREWLEGSHNAVTA